MRHKDSTLSKSARLEAIDNRLMDGFVLQPSAGLSACNLSSQFTFFMLTAIAFISEKRGYLE